MVVSLIRSSVTLLDSVTEVVVTFKLFHVNCRHLNVIVVVAVVMHLGGFAGLLLLLPLPQFSAFKEVLGRVHQA